MSALPRRTPDAPRHLKLVIDAGAAGERAWPFVVRGIVTALVLGASTLGASWLLGTP